MVQKEIVRPNNIRAVEKYLGRKNYFPTSEIVSLYNLTPNPAGLQYSKGEGKDVFRILCDRYPLAKNYKGWGDIYYSMRNYFPVRKEPIETIKIDK